jgi:CheY-like chemotaxis protein
VIKSLGYTAVVATDGEQLLERARNVRPDLVITDALMPRRDGREAAKIIKQEMPATRVVVITSIYKDPRYKYEAYRDFAVDEYLTKPIAPAKLRELIERLIPSAPAGMTP